MKYICRDIYPISVSTPRRYNNSTYPHAMGNLRRETTVASLLLNGGLKVEEVPSFHLFIWRSLKKKRICHLILNLDDVKMEEVLSNLNLWAVNKI